MSDNQLAALAKSSQTKKQTALLKTEKAIASMIENKQKITIRSVAREAGVSVSYIYKYPELSYRIQSLRDQQKYSSPKGDKSHFKADNCLDTLKIENRELTHSLEQLKDHLDHLKTGNKSLDDLQQENALLLIENKKLKQELEYTQEKLQSAREFILSQKQIKESEVENTKASKILRKERKIKQM